MESAYFEPPACASSEAADTVSDTSNKAPPKLLDGLFEWEVTLEQLYLEVIAWKSLRTLHLIRRRQAQDPTTLVPVDEQSKTCFNFAGLPNEVFEVVLARTREACVSHATTQFPFAAPAVCLCQSLQPDERANRESMFFSACEDWRIYERVRKMCKDVAQLDQVEQERDYATYMANFKLGFTTPCYVITDAETRSEGCWTHWLAVWQYLFNLEVHSGWSNYFASFHEKAVTAAADWSRPGYDLMFAAAQMFEEAGHTIYRRTTHWDATADTWPKPAVVEHVLYIKTRKYTLRPKLFDNPKFGPQKRLIIDDARSVNTKDLETACHLPEYARLYRNSPLVYLFEEASTFTQFCVCQDCWRHPHFVDERDLKAQAYHASARNNGSVGSWGSGSWGLQSSPSNGTYAGEWV